VLASSQAEVGTRDSKAERDGDRDGDRDRGGTTGAFALSAVRSALIEWSINLGGEQIQALYCYLLRFKINLLTDDSLF
jgi:hypothetical protein